MPLLDTVNVIGSTIYFVFVILLAWLSTIPRTSPGAGCWAIAILFGMSARLSLMALPHTLSTEHINCIYAFFILLEKCFLLIGAFQFFNLRHLMRPYLLFIACGFLWLAITFLAESNRILFSLGFGIINAAALFLLSYICYRERANIPHRIMHITSIICLLLGIHWLTYPLLRFTDFWQVPGFLLGTTLVLLEYLCLISAILLQFQKRLLEAERNALELAYHDPLTGLNNQRYMTTLFEQALVLALRPHQMLAVFYIDLDNFKPINDSAGHHVGDEVLKVIAKRLVEHTRSTDICARMGGDEFVVIATQLETEEQVKQVANKILQQCCTPVEINKNHYHLGASIGISIYPQHGNDLTQLLQNADDAMYQVKKNGKSGFQVFGA
jgi:diguanylate cyclase (GGDEF)-like protein